MTFTKQTSVAVAMAIVAMTIVRLSTADVVLTEDRGEWENMVGEFTTIDFTGFPHLTPITDQYADDGVLFSGSNFIVGPGCNTYPNDCWGLRGFDGTWVHFDEPMNWLAVDYPGVISIRLYNSGELVFESELLGEFPTGNFAGLQSSVSFDEAYLFRPDPPFNNIAFIDDLHFGGIPAPGALAVILLGAITPRRRRR